MLRLSPNERQKLTAWMVAEFPALSVEALMTKAARAVDTGVFRPIPPTAENIPQGKTLEHAMKVAEQLGLKK